MEVYSGTERSPTESPPSFSLEFLGAGFGVCVDVTVSAQSPLGS
jgi:hypothetical protein